MKRFVNKNIGLALFMSGLFLPLNAWAQEELTRQISVTNDTTVWTLPVKDISLKRNGDLMTIGMNLLLGDYKLKGDKVALFTPILSDGENSIELNSTGLYSRVRYIQYLREEDSPVWGATEIPFKYSSRPDILEFNQSVEYEDWMNGSSLYLRRMDFGCCNTLLEKDMVKLGNWHETIFTPQYCYVTDIQAETVKIREISGRAYVDFPVNQIVIYPDYRNNTVELGKIISTIDSVKNDKDITVTSLHIAGTASPEGPYENNVYLAKNRTIALKDYVLTLYNFPSGFITTSYVPVDWEGLKEWLESNNMQNREQILSIVNSDIESYARNSKIKKEYPEQYQWLLTHVYPSLRHSDYRIEYVIKTFTDLNEIAELIRTSPQKLSLNEMYLLANSLDPESEEYYDVFDTAVRMYPNDEIANLNAANSMMRRNDLDLAERYLARAGDGDKADYARGILELKKGNLSRASELFAKAAATLPEAAKALQELNFIINLEK